MPAPGSPEWHARVAQLLAEEAKQDEAWWYLSFADGALPTGTQFLGACVVKARGMTSAIRRTHELGINPGGEVAAWEVPTSCERRLPINVLMSRAELETFGSVISGEEWDERVAALTGEKAKPGRNHKNSSPQA